LHQPNAETAEVLRGKSTQGKGEIIDYLLYLCENLRVLCGFCILLVCRTPFSKTLARKKNKSVILAKELLFDHKTKPYEL